MARFHAFLRLCNIPLGIHHISFIHSSVDGHLACYCEMAGWHHWLDGRESEWTPGVGDGQGGLACCNSWGRKELAMTKWLNWTEFFYFQVLDFRRFIRNDRKEQFLNAAKANGYSKIMNNRKSNKNCCLKIAIHSFRNQMLSRKDMICPFVYLDYVFRE